jgi:small subunit ribosomal protein S1
VEILDGVEGLVHISELAPHHVESPREIVHPGDEIRVKILEIDSERRRLSLSAKRVEDQILPVARPSDAAGEAPAADAPEAEAAAAEAPEAVEAADAEAPTAEAAEETATAEVPAAEEATVAEVAEEPPAAEEATEPEAAEPEQPEPAAEAAGDDPVEVAEEPVGENVACDAAPLPDAAAAEAEAAGGPEQG